MYAGGRSGTDNGRQKTRNQRLWRHCRRRAIYWLLRSPSQTCHAKPKLKSTGAGRHQLLPARMSTASSLAWKTFSEKSGRCGIVQEIKERGALPMIIVYTRQAIDRVGNIWASLLALVISVRAYWQPDCKIQRSGRNGQRDWCNRAESPRLSPLWLSASSSVRHGLLINNVITPLPTKPSATKCQRTEAGERGNYWHADASAWCCCARCKYTKELADAKAENDALRDDVAAGRRRLHIKAVCQSVREATTASGVDNAASPRLADTAESGLFHPQREADHYAKTTGRNPEVY